MTVQELNNLGNATAIIFLPLSYSAPSADFTVFPDHSHSISPYFLPSRIQSHSSIEQHSVDEPRDGKTDAILFTSPAKLPTNTGIIRYAAPSKQSSSKSTAPPDTESISPSSTDDAAAQPSATKDAGEYLDFLQNPFSVSTPNPAVNRASPPTPSFKDPIIPLPEQPCDLQGDAGSVVPIISCAIKENCHFGTSDENLFATPHRCGVLLFRKIGISEIHLQ
ncbi:hypothetical protein B0H11DRAFT_1925666 [Mycena galericulata]|nr:hypothetical protein B0H11DRAFT_1925666 [Mycena galericulata]